jgi:alpha-glucosidase (family GH31 glycosyl hydrolase)
MQAFPSRRRACFGGPLSYAVGPLAEGEKATRYFRSSLMLTLAAATLLTSAAAADVQRKKFAIPGAYLIVEVLDDDLIHFEASAIGSGPSENHRLYTSPMVLKTDYAGASSFQQNGNVIETSDSRLIVNQQTLCIDVSDKKKGNAKLTTFCPKDLPQAFKGLDIDPGTVNQVYGLGQQFRSLGDANGDWIAHGAREGHHEGSSDCRTPGSFGNGFAGFDGAAVGNVQMPVYYAVGGNGVNYAVLLDNVYCQDWKFDTSPWQVRMFGDQLRWYVLTGPDLPDLRADYMELTGTPPVPPRKAFGLWVSEFGYRNFGEVDNLLNGRPANGGANCPPAVVTDPKRNAICPKSGLRGEHFPVDGFVLDLNWFGGVQKCGDQGCNQPTTHMGRIDWDQDQTPDLSKNPYSFKSPGAAIKAFHDDNIGLVNIEESYLASSSDTFSVIPSNLTVYQRTGGQCMAANQTNAIETISGFWGTGKMIDWSDPAAGKFIHDQRRFPNLSNLGITSHWTDLGEPENYDAGGCYEGVETTASGLKNEHSDIHNLYNLLWNKSIWDGYVAKQGSTNALGITNPRPLILARSAAAGSQRFGVAMWSGDIASTLASLATHYNAQMHMSFSGIDYYGSDLGGFRRERLPYNNVKGEYRGFEKEEYTQWFADGAWTDVPVRPHTDNEFKLAEGAPRYATSPHLVGDRKSNLANLQQRYELIPYYYSLAYVAHQSGVPVVPPPVFYYQNDLNLRGVGHQKMIGRDLMIGIVARHGEYERDVYLPAGRWANYHTNEWIESSGGPLRDVPVYREGILRVPAFARAGALIPKMAVDTATKDVFGHRQDGAPPNTDFILRAYADPTETKFTVFEDDGVTVKYDPNDRPSYHHRETEVRQQQTSPTSVTVTIAPAVDVNGAGAFPGAVNSRQNIVELVVDGSEATAVTLGGANLTKRDSITALQSAGSGWVNAGPNLVMAKSLQMPVSTQKQFVFSLQNTAASTSVNFVCENGETSIGKSVFVVGSIPRLGSWDVSKAIKLDPNIYYEYIYNPPPGGQTVGPTRPVWTAVVAGLPSKPSFEWKCIRLNDDGSGEASWQPDPNNHFQSVQTAGFTGQAKGAF